MDANIYLNELQAIVDQGSAYRGPHGDALAHVYGMTAVLRNMPSSDEQKELIATTISEFRTWFEQRPSAHGADDRSRQNVMDAVAKLKHAYAKR